MNDTSAGHVVLTPEEIEVVVNALHCLIAESPVDAPYVRPAYALLERLRLLEEEKGDGE